MCNRLNADIQRIKLQKVALQKTMESNTKQFGQWRHEREKVRARFFLAHGTRACFFSEVRISMTWPFNMQHFSTLARAGGHPAAQAEPAQRGADPVAGGHAGQAERGAAGARVRWMTCVWAKKCCI